MEALVKTKFNTSDNVYIALDDIIEKGFISEIVVVFPILGSMQIYYEVKMNNGSIISCTEKQIFNSEEEIKSKGI